jgi:glycosyltransferase involved in cell wall biosynthesis/predicted metal-dependent phosphoesterase TrpH
MHCHSTASQRAKLGVQRSLGLPECATPPEEVYELAKRRGMDFVTITDHDTIDGCLQLADRPDTFVSEELTARFAGEAQAVHVLCYGINPGDHEWLQAHAGDLEACAAYLHGNQVTCALAHPFFDVAAPLTQRHRRRLAELFPVWEVRNGSRAPELNLPAVVYIETNGGTGIAGSDDHAGVDIGRTYTEAPPASTSDEFLRHIRNGEASPEGEQGSAPKWAHAAIALATRALAGDGSNGGVAPDPSAVMTIAQRVVREGVAREGGVATDLGPEEALGLLNAWLESIGIEMRGRDLLDHMQADDFTHADLYRRARRIHEEKLRTAVQLGSDAVSSGEPGAALGAVFDALIPAVPYAPTMAFLGAEKGKLRRVGGLPRVAVIADGIGAMHGVTRTVEALRERGVPGFEVEVIGTDGSVDRRLPAAAEFEMPFYDGLRIGVPCLPELVETLAEGRYDLIHVTAPGPAGVAATLLSRVSGMPLVSSYHTELAAYTGIRSEDPALEASARAAVAAFYGVSTAVLSPSPAADRSLLAMGIPEEAIGRWERGVDVERFDPVRAARGAYPGDIKVLYAGRLAREKGMELLADCFLRAHSADPRLHLLVAGSGPEEAALRARLGDAATFLGQLESEQLAIVYASADIFLFCSTTDTYGQVLVEAGASGLPVIAVGEGGPAALIENRHTGILCRPDPDHLAGALLQLAASPLLRRQLGVAAAHAARRRSWEHAFQQLADGYRRALVRAPSTEQEQPISRAA